jgi:hypothetical protein
MNITEYTSIPSLDATIERFLQALAEQGGPPLYTLSPEDARAVLAGVPLPQQAATRAHVLRALLALATGPPVGPQAYEDNGTAGRPVRLRERRLGQ